MLSAFGPEPPRARLSLHTCRGPHLPPFPPRQPLIGSSQSCVSKRGFLSSLSFPIWSKVSGAFRFQTSPLSMKFKALNDLATRFSRTHPAHSCPRTSPRAVLLDGPQRARPFCISAFDQSVVRAWTVFARYFLSSSFEAQQKGICSLTCHHPFLSVIPQRTAWTAVEHFLFFYCDTIDLGVNGPFLSMQFVTLVTSHCLAFYLAKLKLCTY